MPLPTLQVLQAMKRAEIQKLCKVRYNLWNSRCHPYICLQDYGVKANLKTEALIQLLLDIDNKCATMFHSINLATD